MIRILNKDYWFLPFFYAILVTRIFFNTLDFSLSNFAEIIPGTATFHLVNVGERINAFYQSVGLLILAFLSIWLLWSFWLKKNKASEIPVFLKYSSLLGILISLLEFTTAYHETSIGLIVYLQITFIIFSLLKIKEDIFEKFFFISGVSFSLNFLIRESLIILEIIEKPNFIIIQWVSFIALILAYIILQNRIPIRRIASAMLPIFGLPFISVISDELYLISNQRSINLLFSPDQWYVLGVVIIFSIIFYRFLYHNTLKSISTFVNRKMPYYIFISILLNTFYQPIISQSVDMFELANPANGMMRMFKFGEFPIVDFINSHMLQELFYKIIYVILNGYQASLDFGIYDFLNVVIYYSVAIYFLQSIFKNWYFSLVFCLFIPFVEVIIPYHGVLSLFSIYLLYEYYQKKKIYYLLQVLVLAAFLLIWRLDLGVANFMAVVIVGAFISIVNLKKLEFDIKKVRWIFGFGILSLVSFFLFILLSEVDILLNIRKALSYFGASQAHGHKEVSYHFDRFFYNVYFIFPVIIVAAILYSVYNILNKNYDEKSKFLQFSILFLGLYYIFNFQRGLVRHSLLENDGFVNSYFFLILLLFVYALIKDSLKAKLIILFLALFLISNLKYKDALGYHNIFEKFSIAYTDNIHIEEQGIKIVRCEINEKHANESYNDFVSFMNENFSDTATFIDFSNTPMLYFYTQREVPSYFNQYMQNTVTDFLQEKNIDNLKNYDVPVVVFSHLPQEWWDHTDGVPNTIRYSKIANHIFQNYKPYHNINGYFIWIRNDAKIIVPFGAAPEIKALAYKYEYYPYVLGRQYQVKNLYCKGTAVSFNDKSLSIKTVDTRIDNFLELDLSNKTEWPLEFTLKYGDETDGGSYSFKVRAEVESEKYIIPLSCQYNWVFSSYNSFQITKANEIIMNQAKFISNKKTSEY